MEFAWTAIMVRMGQWVRMDFSDMLENYYCYYKVCERIKPQADGSFRMVQESYCNQTEEAPLLISKQMDKLGFRFLKSLIKSYYN